MTPIGTNDTGTSKVDLDCLLETYIPADQIPYDPSIATPAQGDDNTGYTIEEENGRYTVCAPEHAEPTIDGSAEYCLTR